MHFPGFSHTCRWCSNTHLWVFSWWPCRVLKRKKWKRRWYWLALHGLGSTSPVKLEASFPQQSCFGAEGRNLRIHCCTVPLLLHLLGIALHTMETHFQRHIFGLLLFRHENWGFEHLLWDADEGRKNLISCLFFSNQTLSEIDSATHLFYRSWFKK